MERGKNPKSLRNLRPARPGEVRNPTGANKKRPVTDEYWIVAEEPIPLAQIQRFNRKWGKGMLKPGDTWARGLAVRVSCEAVLGGSAHAIAAMKELREAMEGKAPQRLHLAMPETKHITIRIVHDRESRKTSMPTTFLADSDPIQPRPS